MNQSKQCCGQCEHWQADMGLATVRICQCPMPFWAEHKQCKTHRADGHDCQLFVQRTRSDDLEEWEKRHGERTQRTD